MAGGLPVGDRAFVGIRDMPLWGAMEWKVTPPQSVEARKAMEQVDLCGRFRYGRAQRCMAVRFGSAADHSNLRPTFIIACAITARSGDLPRGNRPR